MLTVDNDDDVQWVNDKHYCHCSWIIMTWWWWWWWRRWWWW